MGGGGDAPINVFPQWGGGKGAGILCGLDSRNTVLGNLIDDFGMGGGAPWMFQREN